VDGTLNPEGGGAPGASGKRKEHVDMAGKLEGKVAIVTGAGSSGPGIGTGKAIAVLLAREGSQVILVDRFADRAEETLRMIESDGGDATVVVADLSEVSACHSVVDQAVARYGGVDILVNNAAIASSTGILDTTPELYHQMVAVNMTAPFMLSKAAIPHIVQRGGGSIVHITSIAAMRGQGGKGTTAYATSKAGLMGMMVDLADSFGKDGIRVNCVAPGIIDTPMRIAAMRKGGIEPGSIDLSMKTSLGYEGDAWDIARAVLFLVGPDGRYITGVLLPVDGGTTARSH
jgi:NAD(P)-dependent dehydrogenase (short-subunit alcohol dehydrogenase family)